MAILADSINNNGIYAVRAESDKDGNRIDTVYAKKTEIPSKTSDLTNDSGFVSSSDLATVAETGNYADLSNKPVIPSGDELVPAATAGTDTGKVLTVDNQGSPAWVTPSAGTVYTAGDGVDITNDVISADVDGTTIGIDASTKKIKSLQVIPTKTSDLQNDSNFVVSSSLAVVATSGSYDDLLNKPSIPAAQVNSDWNASSGVAEILNKPTIPTVDQTYNASSTNAQSGTAVAQAIASITPGQTYTAGDGIDITSGTISVKYGPTIDISYSIATESVSTVYDSVSDVAFEVPASVKTYMNMAYSWDPAPPYMELTIPGGTLYFLSDPPTAPYLVIRDTQYVGGYGATYQRTPVTYTQDSETGRYYLDEQTIVVRPLYGSASTLGSDWVSHGSGSHLQPRYFTFSTYSDNTELKTDSATLANAITFKVASNSGGRILNVANPLPASVIGDANKVLSVDYNGNPVWATAQGGSSRIYEASGTDTFADIYAANQAGMLVTYYYSDVVYTLDKLIPSDGSHTSGFIHFINIRDNGGGLQAQSVSGWTYSASDTLTQRLSSKNKDMIPPDPSTHPGKYLVADSYGYGNIVFATPSEVPASTVADENKVLTVDSSGTPVWAASAAPESKPIVGGNCISVTEHTNDVTVAFSTTAGITDIQMVSALPASPVSTVLYLISQA